MFKYTFISFGLILFIYSSSFAMDDFKKEMQEIKEKNEGHRKENTEKHNQMMATLNQAQSIEEKAKVIATHLGVPHQHLLMGTNKLLEKK